MARTGSKKKDLTPEEKLAQALVPVEEQPYPVPGNWCWCRVGSVGHFERGITFPASAKEFEPSEKNIPCLRTANIQDELEIDDLIYVDKTYIKGNNAKLTQPNDIIMSSANSRELVGKTSYVSYLPYPMTFGGFVLTIRTRQIVSKYLFYYLRFQFILGKFMNESTQTTNIANINTSKLAGYTLPLPPLPEQHRIVARIESLFAKLDEAKERAQAVVDGFEERKAAILHKAFTGELTKGWREENKSKLDEWKYVNWEEFLARIEAGKNWRALGRPPRNGEFGVVKVSSVTWGEFNENESKTCQSDEQWNEEVQIHAGDFLFSRANTLQLVGNCVIVESVSRKLMLSDKILRFHFDDSVVSRYVLQYTRSIMYRKQVEELASGNQDGMRNISQKNLRQIQFPIAPLGEQNEIVRILDRILDKQQQAKSAAEQVLDQIDTMKKAILARAFRGELGTNDPAEESAVEMLRGMLDG